MFGNKRNLRDQLPAIVDGMITNMDNKYHDIYVRDNYASQLELIVKVCSEHLEKFHKERTTAFNTPKRAKKR